MSELNNFKQRIVVMTELNTTATKLDIEMILQKINMLQGLLKEDNEFSSDIRTDPVKVLKEHELDVCLPLSADGELLSALLTRTAPVFYESTLDSVMLLLDEVIKGRRVILPNNFWGAWTNGAVSVEVVANVAVWTEAAVATLAVAALAVLGSGSDIKISKTDEASDSI